MTATLTPLPAGTDVAETIGGKAHSRTLIMDPAGADAVGPILTKLTAIATNSLPPSVQPVSGTVSISGTLPVSGTFYQTTQPVSIASAVPVTGTFWQTTQPVSAASLPLPSGASTAALQTTMNTSLGTLATQATAAAMLVALTDTTAAAVTAIQLPTTIGQKAVSNSLSVSLATNHDAIDTVIKSTAASKSAIIGFVGTAAAATTASTTLTVNATTGVPMVGQTISGTGITAGTTITAVSGTAPYSLTLSAAATVASAAAVTSVGMQVLMAANTARRGFVIQNQHATAKFWINGVGNAAADASSLLIGPVSYYETSVVHTGTGAVSVISDTPGIFLYAREF